MIESHSWPGSSTPSRKPVSFPLWKQTPMGRPPLFHHLVGIVSKKLLHCAKQRLLLARPVGWLRGRRLGRGKVTNVMTIQRKRNSECMGVPEHRADRTQHFDGQNYGCHRVPYSQTRLQGFQQLLHCRGCRTLLRAQTMKPRRVLASN